jgi:hypothetical protein
MPYLIKSVSLRKALANGGHYTLSAMLCGSSGVEIDVGIYEIERCPNCNYLLDYRRGVASGTTIGPPIARCPKCQKPYRTNQSEWANKSPAERRAYHWRVAWWVSGAVILWGFGGSIILVVIITSTGFIAEKQRVVDRHRNFRLTGPLIDMASDLVITP